MVFFLISIAILTVLLFFPVSKLIWAFSVRRMQKRIGRELTAEELQGQKRRARFIAFFVCLLFSALFNISMIGVPGHG
jgi:hypothetical protein